MSRVRAAAVGAPPPGEAEVALAGDWRAAILDALRTGERRAAATALADEAAWLQPLIEAGSARGTVGPPRAPIATQFHVAVLEGPALTTLAAVARGRARWVASLCLGEPADDFVNAAAAAGVSLVPAPAELWSICACRVHERLCIHAAALALRVTAEPRETWRTLVTLRGVTPGLMRDRIVSTLPGSAPVDTVSVDALNWADIPQSAAPVLHPGRLVPRPPAVMPPPPASLGLSAEDIAELATDAQMRARFLLAGGEGGLGLGPAADLARRASLGISPTRLATLARRSGREPQEVEDLAAAWRIGGATAVAVLTELWSPDRDALEVGVRALVTLGRVTRWHNRVACRRWGLELRLDRARVWWLLALVDGRMRLVPQRGADPSEVVRAHLGAAAGEGEWSGSARTGAGAPPEQLSLL